MESTLGVFYAISFFAVVLSFLFAAYLYLWVKKQETTNKKVQKIGQLIKEGANTFMNKEYKVLARFAAVA